MRPEPRAGAEQLGRGATSRWFLIGKESPAQNALEAGERQSRSIAGLDEIRLRLGQVHFGIEQIEDRRAAARVARLLDTEAFTRDREDLCPELRAGTCRQVRGVRR